MAEKDIIRIVGAKENNLKDVSVDIPKYKLIVFTGPSGSGKTTLAFDIIYSEGQRRYVESLSSYARQFLQSNNRPNVEHIDGLSPAIAIDQKTASKNPRSIVSTITEIYDYLRLLYARIGIPYSPTTGKPIKSTSASEIIAILRKLPDNTKMNIIAPIIKGQKGSHIKNITELRKKGYSRVLLNGEQFDLDDMPEIDKNKRNDLSVVVDRIVINENLGNRLADSVETALQLAGGLLVIGFVQLPESYTGDYKKGDKISFSEKFACPESGLSISEIEPRTFSFNSPYGACPSCSGIGSVEFFDPALIVPKPSLSLQEGAIHPWADVKSKVHIQLLENLAKLYNFDLKLPYSALSKEIKELLMYGDIPESFKSIAKMGRADRLDVPFKGVVGYLTRMLENNKSGETKWALEKYQSTQKCSECNGHRLRKEALIVKIAGRHIGEITSLSVEDALDWFDKLLPTLTSKEQEIADKVIKEIDRRLRFLNEVGLNYMMLNRSATTLSGGEMQRIRLSSQIGSSLSGVIYILDEPSIGLHQSDNIKLIDALKRLRDIGNTVIVVEHDTETVENADYVIDMGPGAGVNGGEIVAFGTPLEIKNNPNSLTGRFLSGTESIEIPKKRRPVDKNNVLKIIGARENNLKNVDVEIPLGIFTCVTGLSGSGKSTLIIDTLYKAVHYKLNGGAKNYGECTDIKGLHLIDKVIEIDQSPIGKTPRSNPATYTAVFTLIRDLYVSMPESKARGYKAGRFSFNVTGGRCEACQGDGMIKITMYFLPDVYVQCDTCHGKRYNRETLEVTYKGKSISDVLNMSVEESCEFFSNIAVIKEKLQALYDVGLGYITIGQSATSLSGGEAQRIKLAKELCKRSTGKTLYILDEPTTGLHNSDIKRLLNVLQALANQGNTLLLIEHNMDVIKTADWLIDVGPKGGVDGGRIIAIGTPEQVANVKESITGEYLKKLYGM